MAYISLAPPLINIETRDMDNVFFTSDWHLNHESILYFTKRYDIVKDKVFDKFYMFDDNNVIYHIGETLHIEGSDIVLTYKGKGDTFNSNFCTSSSNDLPFETSIKVLNERNEASNIVLHKIDFSNKKNVLRTHIINVNNEMLKRCNDTLPENAILFNCGDLMLSHISELDDYLDMVKAKRIYVTLGNHDYANWLKKGNHTYLYNEDNRIQVSNQYIIRLNKNGKLQHMFSVSHVPLPICRREYNIHGHLHSTPNLDDYKSSRDYEDAIRLRADGRHFDCGVDRNDYKPVCLSDIIKGNSDIKFQD